LNTWYDQLWIPQSKLTGLDGYKSEQFASNCPFLTVGIVEDLSSFCQLPDSYLGLEMFMNVDQFIIVCYLKKEVWGFESYSLSGTTSFQWNNFVWSLRFFFLVVHLNIT
jgi:hypothetical protein